MRDIRGDLQDRAGFLEEQISAAQAQFENLIGQLKREHQAKVGDLQAELEAVTRLMEVEYRRLTSPAPVQDERRRTAPPSEAEPRRQASVPEAEPQYRRPEAEHERRPAPEAEPEVEQDHRPAAPQVYRRPAPMASAPDTEQRRSVAMASQQPQPLADFLIRKLSEIGAMTLDDLCHLSVQDGYFAEGEIADRAIHATLVNIAKAGFIRQLPNGTFAPATVMDTIRLRRAI